MTSKRFFFVMLLATAILVLSFAGGVYKAEGMLKDESNKLLDLKITNSVLDLQRSALEQAQKDINEFSELEQITRSIVPADKDQANTIGEIATNAKQAGIQLGAIEFPQSELGQAARGKSKSPASKDNSKSQLLALEDLKGVYVMEIDIRNHSEHTVSYKQIIKFLELLESNRRTAQVIDISIQPDSDNPSQFDFTIKLNTYVRPES